jgi:hypothetical protein
MMRRRTFDVPCTVEIEQTPESFHAHAIPLGIAIGPGDRVLVHGAPARVGFGARVSLQCRATVTRASWLQRVWTQAFGLFELTELYEVGFAPEELP